MNIFLDEKIYEYRVWFHKQGGDVCLRIKSIPDRYDEITNSIELMCKELEKRNVGIRETKIYIVYKDNIGIWWEANALAPMNKGEDMIRTFEEQGNIDPFKEGNVIVFKL